MSKKIALIRDPIDKICALCGQQFNILYTKNKRKLSRRFCSRSCSTKSSAPNRPPRSEEFKRRLSLKMSGSGNHFYGKRHTNETKKILSKSNQRKPEDFVKFDFKSQYEVDVFNGIMISDGSISAPTRTSARFTLGFKYKNTILRIIKDLSSIRFGKIYDYNFLSKSAGSILTNYFVKSFSYYTFIDYYNIWYKDKNKIIPQNIKFTKLMCYWWYVCDGYKLSKNTISLCTDSFDKNSIDYAIQEFSNYDLITTLNKRNRLVFDKDNTNKFINYIKDIKRQEEYDYKFSFSN